MKTFSNIAEFIKNLRCLCHFKMALLKILLEFFNCTVLVLRISYWDKIYIFSISKAFTRQVTCKYS